jgi:hypothetical protein
MNWNRTLLGALLVYLSLVGQAPAGQITNLQLYDGTSASPIVTVTYSGPTGTGTTSEAVYADPQVSGGTTAPIYYCVDLWHDNDLGSTYTITPVSTLSYATSTFADVDNRLAWLVNQAQNTVDERAAVQLAMWYTIDNIHTASFSGFSFTGGDSALVTDYSNLISFAGYDPGVNYSAQLWAATHDAGNTLYQDLISAGPPITTTSVPEPGAGILAAVGLGSSLGLYGRRRMRRRAGQA